MNFSTFCCQFWFFFQPKSVYTSLKAHWVMSSISVDCFPIFWPQNGSKSHVNRRKNVKMLKLLDSFGVIRKRFWNKTTKSSFQKSYGIVRSFVVDCIGTFNRISRMLNRNCIFDIFLKSFDIFRVNLRQWSFTKRLYLSTKAYWNNKFSHCALGFNILVYEV